MRKILKVEHLKEAVPQKGVWYDHADTIFISVMRKSKNYIKRKSKPPDNKVDNELSEWHRKWQYERIEFNYGTEKFGVKSYEHIIKVNEEVHRIDSLVQNLAIEFQHTLSVDIEEMQSRFHAHSSKNFIPYLVIDFTDFYYNEYHSAYFWDTNHSILKKMKKWLGTEYAKNNNLFIDFKDKIIRVVHNVPKKHFAYTKEYFIDKLLELENERYEAQKAEQKRLENQKLEEARIEKEEYIYHRRNSSEFNFYRKCFSEKEIYTLLKPHKEEVFYYQCLGSIKDEHQRIIKTHAYKSDESKIEIRYYTFGEVRNIYEYLFAEVEILKMNKVIAKFRLLGNNTDAIKLELPLPIF